MLDDRYGTSGSVAPSSSVVNGGYVTAPAAAAAGALAANPVVSAISVQAASGDATFNLELDAEAAAAPSSYTSGWITAATLLSKAIHDPITVNIEVGYTEYPEDNSRIASSVALGDVAYGTSDSYRQVSNFLSATGASDVVNAVNALPNTNSLNGVSNVFVASPEEKVFGQISGSATAIDGYVGFGTGWDGSIVGGALHEFTHAMGRIVGDSVLSLFRYTSSGTHYFGNNTPSPATYFSVDGGKTILADFGENSDPADFLNNSLTVNDPLDETVGGNSLTALDRTMLDMLGFGGTGPITNGATDLAIDTTTTGAIDNVGDQHTYKITLTAGTLYAFNLDGYDVSSSYSLRDPYLQLLDSSGKVLATSDDISPGNWSSQIDYTAATGGTYYLEAASSPSDGTYTTGSYQIRSSTPPDLAIGATAGGEISYVGDQHAYKVTLTAGTRYAFNLDGYDVSSSYSLRDPYLQLLDSSGKVLATSDDISPGNWSSEIDYTVATGGTYYLEAASSPSDGTYTTGSYQIRSSTPPDLAIGATASGEIGYVGDQHAYKVTLTAGTLYAFNLDGYDVSSSYSLRDPYLQLLDSSGKVLATSDDISPGNWSSQIDYTAAIGGTYYLEAASSPSDGTYTTGSYQIRSSTPPDLAIGATSSGEIGYVGDQHAYKVTLTAGTLYAFNLDGYDVSSSYSLRDPYLQLLDSSGKVLATSDDISPGNWSSQIDYTAATGGTYYLEAASSPSDGTYTTGSYQIRSSTPPDLAIGATAGGEISYVGDQHAYKVTLTAGTLYAFNLDGYDVSSSYTLRDPYLQLLDSSGKVLATSDDISPGNWSSEIDYTAATGGTYYLEAASSPSDGTYTTGSYQIRSSVTSAASPIAALSAAHANQAGNFGFTIVPVASGDQTLTADPKPEIFDFSGLDFGSDTIVGFDPTQDALHLSSRLADNFATVSAGMSATAAGGTLIDLDKTHSITLNGISPGSLSGADFRFT